MDSLSEGTRLRSGGHVGMHREVQALEREEHNTENIEGPNSDTEENFHETSEVLGHEYGRSEESSGGVNLEVELLKTLQTMQSDLGKIKADMLDTKNRVQSLELIVSGQCGNVNSNNAASAPQSQASMGDTQFEQNIPSPNHSVTKIKPATFDGSTSWDDYLLQFQMISQLNGWSDSEKLVYMAVNLRGVACEVFGDVDPEMRKDFTSLVTCLTKRFGPEKQEEIYRTLLQNRVQGPDESYADLAHKIRRLVKYAYPGLEFARLDNFAKEHFIKAIRDPKISDALFFHEPSDLDEAVRLAIKADTYYDSRNKKAVTHVRNVQTSPHDSLGNKPELSISSVDKTLAEDMRKIVIQLDALFQSRAVKAIGCFGCGELGHVKAKCPNNSRKRHSNSRN